MGMKLILLGAPGAGKGTQAEILSNKLSIPTISTGNILRAAMRDGTPLGLQIKACMDAGQLVPDELVIGIVVERLAQADCANGYILDGVPRTLAQAEALDKHGVEFDHVISIEIEDEVIEARMSGRRVCPACGTPFHMVSRPPKQEGVCDNCGAGLVQRNDDKPETVRERLEIYHRETEPLKEFYAAKGLVRSIQNQPTIEATSAIIMEALGI